MNDLDRTFDAALAESVRDASAVTVLCSGGIDSTLIAWGLRNRPGVRLLAIGLGGSKDLQAAKSAGEILGLPFDRKTMSEAEVEQVLRKWREQLSGLKEPQRSVAAAFAVALDAAGAGRTLCGQGADELFLGYAHFRNLSAAEASDVREGDLRRLQEEDWPLACRVGRAYGSELRAPFLDPMFVKLVTSVPIEQHLSQSEAKPLLRIWARHRGIREPLASRPKLAFQYGSGVKRTVDRLWDS